MRDTLIRCGRCGESNREVKTIEVFGKDINRKGYKTLHKQASSQIGRDFRLTSRPQTITRSIRKDFPLFTAPCNLHMQI